MLDFSLSFILSLDISLLVGTNIFRIYSYSDSKESILASKDGVYYYECNSNLAAFRILLAVLGHERQRRCRSEQMVASVNTIPAVASSCGTASSFQKRQ